MKIKSDSYFITMIVILVAVGMLWSCENGSKDEAQGDVVAGEIEQWVTTGDKSQLLKKQEQNPEFGNGSDNLTKIVVDTTRVFQSIDGFGFALTGGSAYLLHEKLSPEKRASLLKELFATDGNNIGISYLRVSIGASDLDDHVFSYNDMARGKADPALAGFTLEEDEKHVIPVLKEILDINPSIKIMGSPWSAPAWMKDNGSPKGGRLKKEYYPAFANYFVKYIQGMKQHGITIDAITLQNEPENPKNNPSMVMTAGEQAEFVKNFLGPLFEKEKIETKIVVFDHNCDHPEYPIAILDDPEAKKYVDGSAFHLYLGDINALSKVHDAHPDRNIYFTEQWTSPEGTFDGDLKWHTKNLIIGATRNWSKNVLEWNLAADPQFNPHTDDGGCTMCLGALTVDGDQVSRNVSYYIIAHGSKFVRPGSKRIESSWSEELPNVAFITPEGKKILIVLNETNNKKDFYISDAGRSAKASLPGGAVSTFVW